MVEPAKSACDIGFTCWDRSAKYRSYIWELEEKVKNVNTIMASLDALYKDVKMRVDDAEDHFLSRTAQADEWLKRVELNKMEVEDVLEKGRLVAENKCLCGFCPNSWPSRLKYGKIAEDKLATLQDILNQGRKLGELTYRPSEAVLREIPHDPAVGVDSIFKKVWNHVEDETVRSIGLFGMGGVGKTTILKKIHNNFLQVNHDYNLVIWNVVSQHDKPQDVAEKVQKTIWQKLDLSNAEWDGSSDQHARATKILDIITKKKKRFLLFLDGVWERIDLLELGVPWQNHELRSKLIFTTRLEDACIAMRADKRVRVDCLPPKEALELFRMSVDKETLDAHPQIPELAEFVARECRGLPLALVSMGRAMSGMSYTEWRGEIEAMKKCPIDLPPMRKEVFPVLRYSYNRLPDETHRKCFLYCSLFPDGHAIPIHSLIDFWIAEGFLEGHDDIYEARAYCLNTIIRELAHSCLLELLLVPNTSEDQAFVKLHGVILDMALWIASDEGPNKNKFLVQENKKSFELWELERWKSAERISLWHVNQVLDEFPSSRITCSNLSTLILRETCGKTFPDTLFSSVPCLKVLDLSGNRFLNKLPNSIGQLSLLRFLSLEGTFIRRLPTTVKNLIKLVFLFVNYKCAPKEVIVALPSLRVFRKIQEPSITSAMCLSELEMLEVLDKVKGIREISLQLRSPESLKKLSSFPVLCGRLRHLRIRSCNISITSLETTMEDLQRLELDAVEFEQDAAKDKDKDKDQDQDQDEDEDEDEDDDQDKNKDHDKAQDQDKVDIPPEIATKKYFANLIHLEIANQVGADLKLVSLCAPRLEFLCIKCCESVREVISVEDSEESDPDRIFPCLTYLKLEWLPRLMRICKRTLAFPSLQCLEVAYCENLRKLPFDANIKKTSSLLEIRGPQLWWNGLQWDDPVAQQVLSEKFTDASFII